MKFMFARPSFVRSLAITFFITAVLGISADAQAKKVATPPKKDPKASQISTKQTAKQKEADKKAKSAKATKAADKKTVASKSAREKDKNARADAKRNNKPEDKKAADRNAKSKIDKARPDRAETRRLADERRRREADQRQAALEERRRREQVAREARERALAFERGLKTETRANIAKDVTEGEDLAIRNAAINALGNHAGSVVVMEAKTGKILTIVNQDWAVRTSIRPCSTIKLVTGVAGVSEKVIDPATGAMRTSPNGMTLDDALAVSNNPYFQRVGTSIGNLRVIEYAKKLGLGAPTGINLEGEAPGRLPYNNNSGLIYSHGDDFEVSTLQLAVMASAIANGGNRVLPRIPRNAVEKTNFQTFYRDRVGLPAKELRRVIPGMMGAAEYGTARRSMDQALGVAGKTGSCRGGNTWTGLFTSVAPIEDPKYAVAVITRGPGERGRNAAAIAARIYTALAPGIQRTDRNLAQTEFKLRPRNGGDTRTLTTVASEEADADETTVDGREVILVQSAPRSAPQEQRKLVTRTGSSQPTFPPVVITYDKDAEKKPGSTPKP